MTTQSSSQHSQLAYEQACFTLAKQLGELLKQRQWCCAVAESCTGGSLAATITDCSGSSSWFDRGFVTYSNQAKQDLLDVSAQTLTQYGAVSAETVREMAEGALRKSMAQIAVAISGIAGPEGGSVDRPVGTVWIAWALSAPHKTEARCFLFQGNRATVRQQAVHEALQGMLQLAQEGLNREK